MKIIHQGAEATIKQNNNEIVKERIKKNYRIPEIDKQIIKLRTRSEARLLERTSAIIPVPNLLKSDETIGEIWMEFIDGKKLSECLNKFTREKQIETIEKISKNVAKLHKAGIIHGDLTTSNMILKDKRIYFIDFGLGFMSEKFEDRAVDIWLLKQALEGKHFETSQTLFEKFLQTYKEKFQDSEKVLERLKAVEKRRRYKH